MQNFTLQPQIFAKEDLFHRKYRTRMNITDLARYDFVEIPHQTFIDKRSEKNSHKSFEVHVFAIYFWYLNSYLFNSIYF